MKVKFLCLIAFLFCGAACPTFAGAKSDFIYLYQSEWSRANLNYKLYKMAEDSFQEQTRNSAFNTSGFQIRFNINNIVERIQEGIFVRFRNDYEELLKRMGTRLPNDHAKILASAERNFVSSIWPELETKFSSPLLPLISMAAGIGILFSIRFFTKRVKSKFDFSRSSTVFVEFVILMTGLLCFSFGIFQVSQVSAMTRAKARTFLYESTKDFYANELPNLLKDAIN